MWLSPVFSQFKTQHSSKGKHTLIFSCYFLGLFCLWPQKCNSYTKCPCVYIIYHTFHTGERTENWWNCLKAYGIKLYLSSKSVIQLKCLSYTYEYFFFHVWWCCMDNLISFFKSNHGEIHSSAFQKMQLKMSYIGVQVWCIKCIISNNYFNCIIDLTCCKTLVPSSQTWSLFFFRVWAKIVIFLKRQRWSILYA